jgi:hypothetical protein
LIIAASTAVFLKRPQNRKPIFVAPALKLQTPALIVEYSSSHPIL